MIINWIKSLFHKKPDEILKLKEVIDKVNSEKEQLQKDLDRTTQKKKNQIKKVALKKTNKNEE